MSNFHLFKAAVATKFQQLSQHELFRTNVSGDDLWTSYLAEFPEGSNPIYRKRTEEESALTELSPDELRKMIEGL